MGTKIECHNCGHEWEYTGSLPAGAHTNCPNRDCRYKVRIPEDDRR